MGWRGTLRSMAAASRAAQRDAERRRKARAKSDMASAAAEAVWEWQRIMEDLVSLHADRTEMIDWHEIAESPAPEKPSHTGERELNAQALLDAFRPGTFDFLSGGTAKRRQKLLDAVDLARWEDGQANQDAERQYELASTEWLSDTALARRLLKGEAGAIHDVIAEMQQSLSKEGLIGTSINFLISDGSVHAVARIHSDEIVPSVRRKQLASGRLSETKMPAGEFNELYQDYVCSAALRVGGDLLNVLPLDEVYVTCTPPLLDSANGHQRPTPVLSVQIVRETFDSLRLAGIDPSDAMKNFNHAMDFRRTKGFAEIKPLKPID